MSKNTKKELTPKKSLRDISPEAKKRAALLVFNTLILTFIYFGSMGINQPILALIVNVGYWIVLAVLVIIYVIYNRGFTQKNLTAEMLPDSWDAEKKAKYIEGAQRRDRNSRWMLTVIIPIMIPIMLDAISLFTWPIIQNLFGCGWF
jgi:hypothetical protein